jgi:CBS domain containing-hemolysin-like protein
VNDYFGTDIEDPDNDTIGGWVFSRLKEVPRIGDEVRHNGWIFTVQEIDQRSVTRLLVKPEKKAAEGNLDRTN